MPPCRQNLPPSVVEKNHREHNDVTRPEKAADSGAEDFSEDVEDPGAEAVFVTQGSTRALPPCPACGEAHPLGRCKKFQEMQPTGRKGLLDNEGSEERREGNERVVSG